MPDRRTIFFLSDHAGITAEALGNNLLSQFEDVAFERQTIPFIDAPDKVEAAIQQVNATAAREGKRPIVFASVVDEIASQHIHAEVNALTQDQLLAAALRRCGPFPADTNAFRFSTRPKCRSRKSRPSSRTGPRCSSTFTELLHAMLRERRNRESQRC